VRAFGGYLPTGTGAQIGGFACILSSELPSHTVTGVCRMLP
jgi:hypothetical protein